ncbi:MAG TPA: DNA mismatch endonuclease Vsr [Ktedonobacterales bacterium]|nr:DNA mismatch endonuclease Vsr [Ktedonobacterales bacterium]
MTDAGHEPAPEPADSINQRAAGRPKRDAAEITAIMRRVRGRDTTPELRLRQALSARGLRYTVAPATLPGKPDIVFAGARLAVFVDGDYWHGNQWRRRGKLALEEQFQASAATSRAYWLRKIRRNMRRDCETTAALLGQGWVALRLWESQIAADMEGCVNLIADTLAARQRGAASPVGPERDDVASVLRGRLPERTVAEFFAGIGLMRLGLERSGWRITFANDIDERKQAMYLAHFGGTSDPANGEAESHFALGDVHALPVDCVPSVTLATASFPCNDLSLAGARQGLAGSQSSAFWGFIRTLDELGARRPPLVLLENVPGFLSSHGGADFTRALLALDALGYAVDTFQLDAAHFTPQSRRRLFVVGAQMTLFGPPATDTRDTKDTLGILTLSPTRPPALLDAIATNADVRWRVRPLPTPPERDRRLEDILDDLPDDAPEWWSAERASYLLSQMSPRHRALADTMIAGERWSYGAVFRRMRKGHSMAELRADGLAGCLRTPRGGSGRQIIFKAGFGRHQARLLTAREAARLMGAGEFRISGSLNDALFGFGDAVCADAIAWIATYYLDPLVNELIRGAPLRAASASATMDAR